MRILGNRFIKLNRATIFITMALIVLVGLGFSIFTYKELERADRYNLKVSFERDFNGRISVYKRTLDMIPFSFKLISDYYYQSWNFDRETFKSFVGPFLPEIYGMRAVLWAPRIKLEQRDEFVLSARKEGMSHFKILERNSSQELTEARQRQEYYPVLYAESPEERREIGLGFDLASEQSRYQTLIQSRDTGKVVATPKITLLTETSNEFGFLLFCPVYRIGTATASTEARRKNITGFFIGVFRWREIIEKSMAGLQPVGIDITVYDDSDSVSDQMLYNHVSRVLGFNVSDVQLHKNPLFFGIQRSTIINIGERAWRFTLTPRQSYISKRRTVFPLAGFLAGIISTFVLAFFSYRQLLETVRIRGLVDIRTKALKQSEERLELALKGAELGLWDWNIRTGYVFFNERWTEMLGYQQSELAPHIDSWRRMLHPDEIEKIYKIIDDHLAGKTPFFKMEHRMLTKAGKWIWILATGRVFEWDEDKKPSRATGVHLDITDSKEYEEKLQVLSITDPLTNIYNRRYFFEQLQTKYDQMKREKSCLSITIVDIDHFKLVNDDYGHQAGDFILREFAALFKKTIRPYDLLARYGGEEFILLTVGSDKTQTLAVIQRVLDTVRDTTFKFNDIGLHFTFSGGISDSTDIPDSEKVPTKLISIADVRLYSAKESGRNRIFNT